MSSNPLEQFKVFTLIELPRLFGYNVDFTNASLYMILSLVVIAMLGYFGLRKPKLIPGGCQSVMEMVYEFVTSLLSSNVGPKGLEFTPMVMTIFLFVLTANLLGMLPLPYSFTITSHIIVTFTLAMIVFISVTYIGFRSRGLNFFRVLLPEGTPMWLAPMMILIELCAYFARPISLSVRLAANMIAGHTIIKVIAGFVVEMGAFSSILPFAFIMILIAFEIFVAALQAYIFAILTCVYLSDAANGH